MDERFGHKRQLQDSDIPGTHRTNQGRRAFGGRITTRHEPAEQRISPLAEEVINYPILNRLLFFGLDASSLREKGFPGGLVDKWAKDILKGILPAQFKTLEAWATACTKVYKSKGELMFDRYVNIVSTKK